MILSQKRKYDSPTAVGETPAVIDGDKKVNVTFPPSKTAINNQKNAFFNLTKYLTVTPTTNTKAKFTKNSGKIYSPNMWEKDTPLLMTKRKINPTMPFSARNGKAHTPATTVPMRLKKL